MLDRPDKLPQDAGFGQKLPLLRAVVAFTVPCMLEAWLVSGARFAGSTMQ